MKQLIERFRTYLLTEKRVSPNTFAAYATDIAQFQQFLLQQRLDPKSLTPKEVKLFLHQLKSQQLSARTLSRKISSLKSFFAYLHEYAELPDFGRELIFPKIEKRLPQYLTEPEIEKLLAAAYNDKSIHAQRNNVMLSLLYVTGMRISELTGLKASDVRFDTGYLIVQGKGGKQRMIPLPQPIIPVLKEYLEKSLLHKRKETDYLFPIMYGKRIRPITRQALWGILKQLWKKTGIQKEISPHQLRHSLATHMLKRGADLRSLQTLLGHENLATVEIYTHVETSYLRTIYNKKHPRS